VMVPARFGNHAVEVRSFMIASGGK